MADIEFVPGLIVKAPHERAPEFVKATISIKVEDLGKWLRERYKAGEEWVNLDVKVSKKGTWYAAVNTYKPKEKEPAPKKEYRKGDPIEDIESDLPF